MSSFDLKQSSKGSPLAVGDGFSPSYRLGFRRGARIGLIVAGFVFLFAFGLGIQFARADSVMEYSYGKWVKIDPANVLKEVPVYVPPRSSAGAVTNEYKRQPQAPLVVHSFQHSKPITITKADK